MRKPCFNIIYEEENITIPEIDNTDFINFSMAFVMIIKRKKFKRKNKKLKVVNF